MYCITSHPGSPSPNHAIAIFDFCLGISTLQQKSSIGPFFLVPPKALYSPSKRVFSYLSPSPQEFESVWYYFTIYTHLFLYSLLLNIFSPFPVLEFFFFLFLYYSTCIFPFSLLFSALFLSLGSVWSGSVWSGSVCMGPRFSQVWVYDFQSMDEVFFLPLFLFHLISFLTIYYHTIQCAILFHPTPNNTYLTCRQSTV